MTQATGAPGRRLRADLGRRRHATLESRPVTSWRPTPSLVRASLLALGGLGGGVVAGLDGAGRARAPFVVLAAMGLLARPRSTSRTSVPGSTTSGCTRARAPPRGWTSTTSTGVEHVTRVAAPAAARRRPAPLYGASGALVRRRAPDVEVSPRRWGRRAIGGERVALTSAWAGWRWVPVDLPEHGLSVLPQSRRRTTAAPRCRRPTGLVGRHRSRRIGSGTEFEGIRPFATGDRLKRITWPVSLRTGELHVITTRAEQDAGVWLVVDGLRDIGVSGGIDGAASSLDLTVRAAAALAEHHIRTGDRVGLLVVAADGARVRLGSGSAPPPADPGHPGPGPHRGAQRRARAARPRRRRGQRRLRAVADALHPARHRDRQPPAQRRVGGRHRHLRRRRACGGPARAAEPGRPDAGDRARGPPRRRWPRWAARWCPGEGPGTLDTVLHQLARRARVPRVRAR